MCSWDLPTRPPLGSVGEESRMEEGVKRAPGVETLFPVCISCVFNVKLRPGACFLCVMGARPKTPNTKTTHRKSPPMSVTGQTADIHIRTHSQPPVYRILQNEALERQRFSPSVCLTVFLFVSLLLMGRDPQDLSLMGGLHKALGATLQKH